MLGGPGHGPVLSLTHGRGTYTLPGGMYLAAGIEPDPVSSTQIEPFLASRGPARGTPAASRSSTIAQMTSPWVHSTGTPSLAAASSLTREEDGVAVGALGEEAGGLDVKPTGTGERPQRREAALGGARQELGWLRLGSWGVEVAQAGAERSGVETVDEGPRLPHAATGERTLQVRACPSVACLSVTVAHDIDRIRRHERPLLEILVNPVV